MHCSAYAKDQLPVIIVDLQDVNLIVASEKGLLTFILQYGIYFKTKTSRTWEPANFQWPLINREHASLGYTARPMAQFERTFRWK